MYCCYICKKKRVSGFAGHPYVKQRRPGFTSHPYVKLKRFFLILDIKTYPDTRKNLIKTVILYSLLYGILKAWQDFTRLYWNMP